jgi:hypothetical protein
MANVWVTEHNTTWSGFSRTNNPSTNINTLDGGAWTDAASQAGGTGAIWLTFGSGVTLVPVTSGGAYTVAPTGATLQAPTGSSSVSNFTWTAVPIVSGSSPTITITGFTVSNAGENYIAVPTGPTITGGTNVTPPVFGTPVLGGNVAGSITTGLPYTFFGAQGFLYRAAAALNQGMKTYAFAWAGNLGISAAVRYNGSNTNPQAYVAFLQPGTNGSTPNVSLYYYSNYTGSAGIQTKLLNAVACTGVTTVYGHNYSVAVYATGASPTSLYVVVNDETANPGGATFTSSTVTDGSAGTQTVGNVGTSVHNGSMQISQMTALQPAFVISPNPVPLNNTSQTVTCTFPTAVLTPGATSQWSLQANGTSASLTSQVNTSSTVATLVISTGGVVGSPTITDTASGQVVTLTISVMVAPTITSSITYGAPGSTPTLTFGGPIANGVPPYTVTTYGSPNVNFNVSSATPDPSTDPSKRSLNVQTISDSVTTPSSFVDSSPTTGANFYTIYVVDSQGQGVASVNNITSSMVLRGAWNGLNIVGGVDSIDKGTDGDLLPSGQVSTVSISIRRATSVNVSNGGHTYSGSVTATCAAIPGIQLVPVVVAGVITRVYIAKPGYGNLSESTTYNVLFTDGTGSGAVGTVIVGGGYYLALQESLRAMTGLLDIYASSFAVGGSGYSNWAVPSNPFLPNMISSMAAMGGKYLVILKSGSNDSIQGITPSAYNTALTYIVGQLLASSNVAQILILQPNWAINSTATTQGGDKWLIQQYAAQCAAVAAANPGKVTYLASSWFNWTLANQPNWSQSSIDNHWPGFVYGTAAASILSNVSRILGLEPQVHVIGG